MCLLSQSFSHLHINLLTSSLSTLTDMLLDTLQSTCSYTNCSGLFETTAVRKHGGAYTETESALQSTLHEVTTTFQSALKGGHMSHCLSQRFTNISFPFLTPVQRGQQGAQFHRIAGTYTLICSIISGIRIFLDAASGLHCPTCS